MRKWQNKNEKNVDQLYGERTFVYSVSAETKRSISQHLHKTTQISHCSVLVHSASENSTLLIFRVLNIFEQLSKWISQVIDYSLFTKKTNTSKMKAKNVLVWKYLNCLPDGDY